MKVLPTAIRVGGWMAILGLICGVFYSVGGFFYDLFTIGLNWGTALAFLALGGMPALFGAFGFLFGAIFAVLGRGVGRLLRKV